MNSTHTLSVTLHLHSDKGENRTFATLLQRGFILPLEREMSITELLASLPGFTLDYLQERVQTIFVNGVSEDNIDRIVKAGDTLALSAAMPGLAGAIFRRGGQHASLRTHLQQKKNTPPIKTGCITLKLFNMIASETGPEILQKGILIEGRIFVKFLQRQEERIAGLLQKIEVEKKELPLTELLSKASKHDLILLKIKSNSP